jgi:hypothetical protein
MSRFQKFPPSPHSDDCMKDRVEVQKGSIDPNPMTSKFMKHSQKLVERHDELRLMRYGQTLDYHEPKK